MAIDKLKLVTKNIFKPKVKIVKMRTNDIQDKQKNKAAKQ